jgi:hypothetical protein
MQDVKAEGGAVTLDCCTPILEGFQLDALKRLKACLRDGMEYPYPQLVDDSDPRLIYTGPWEDWSDKYAFSRTERKAMAAGASVEYSFTGKSVKWIGSINPDLSSADVYLDEVLTARNVDCQTAVYWWYTDNHMYQQTLFWKVWESNGPHTIKLVANGKVGFDGFETEQPETTIVDDRDGSIQYTGTWVNVDTNQSAISGTEKHATSTNSALA